MKKKHISNILIFTALTGLSIHGINKAINLYAPMKNLLKAENGSFFHWRYGNIYYTKHGKGTPLLLVHDLNPSASEYEWHKLITQLSKHHTVYTVDLLGCGRSGKPNMTYSNFLYVQLITDFIKNIIGTTTDVITSGESCSFTLMACNMESDLFGKIIVINPSNLSNLCKTPDKKKNALKSLIDLPIIGTFLYNLVYLKKNIGYRFYKEYYSNKHMVSLSAIDYYYEAAHLEDSHGKYLLSSIMANYTNINIVHALKKITNRIYLIGSIEKEGMQDIIDSYISCNPSIEASYISGSKHLPQLEKAKKIIQIITDLL